MRDRVFVVNDTVFVAKIELAFSPRSERRAWAAFAPFVENVSTSGRETPLGVEAILPTALEGAGGAIGRPAGPHQCCGCALEKAALEIREPFTGAPALAGG